MKKTYVKSAMEVHPCEPQKLKGDAAEKEIEQQLNERSNPPAMLGRME